MNDAFDLERFVTAQDPVIDQVLNELRRGRKTGHWMWFVFPQLKGLGSSNMASHYGIASLDEAKAYLEHPVLGPRLTECTELVNVITGQSIEDVLGGIDALKFRSSMTLFAEASGSSNVFAKALDQYFAGKQDQMTLDRLAQRQRAADV